MVERTTHWLTGLLLLAIAGLSAVIVLELSGGVAIAPEVTAAASVTTAASEAPAEPPGFLPPSERQFEEISERPLFFPSRRPFVPAAAIGPEVAPAADPVAAVVLIGVLLSEGQRAALVQPQGEAGARWVHERQTVAGWLVEEIAADHVRLRADRRVETVKLRADQVRAPGTTERRRRSTARPAAEPATAGQAQTAPVK